MLEFRSNKNVERKSNEIDEEHTSIINPKIYYGSLNDF